jgi:hypothetical protein
MRAGVDRNSSFDRTLIDRIFEVAAAGRLQ